MNEIFVGWSEIEDLEQEFELEDIGTSKRYPEYHFFYSDIHDLCVYVK